jgi:hypothetical protein
LGAGGGFWASAGAEDGPADGWRDSRTVVGRYGKPMPAANALSSGPATTEGEGMLTVPTSTSVGTSGGIAGKRPAAGWRARAPGVGPINALTVDVEDYYQVEGFAGVVRREDWGR